LSLATVGITVAVSAPLNRRFTRWAPMALPGGLARAYPALECCPFDPCGNGVGSFRVRHSCRNRVKGNRHANRCLGGLPVSSDGRL
jgi:hypothetical protein